MTKRNRKPSHPGIILKHHFLAARGVSQKDFAESIEVSETHLNQIINEHKRLEPDVAVRIAKALETTTGFWLDLQVTVDVWTAEQARKNWEPKIVFSATRNMKGEPAMVSPMHPGSVLKEEFMEPYELSAHKLADVLSVASNHITSIVSGECGITAQMALRLSDAFGTTPEF